MGFSLFHNPIGKNLAQYWFDGTGSYGYYLEISSDGFFLLRETIMDEANEVWAAGFVTQGQGILKFHFFDKNDGRYHGEWFGILTDKKLGGKTLEVPYKYNKKNNTLTLHYESKSCTFKGDGVTHKSEVFRSGGVYNSWQCMDDSFSDFYLDYDAESNQYYLSMTINKILEQSQDMAKTEAVVDTMAGSCVITKITNNYFIIKPNNYENRTSKPYKVYYDVYDHYKKMRITVDGVSCNFNHWWNEEDE